MGEIHPLMWVAIGLAVIGMVLPVPKIIPAETDPLACTTATTNCSGTYCPTAATGIPQSGFGCSAINCLSFGSRTSTFTTSSITFVTILSSVDLTCGGASPSNALCITTWNYRVNAVTGNVQFKILNNVGLGVGNVYQVDDAGLAASNSAEIGSLIGLDSGGTSVTWNLQAKVSVATITLSVLKADINCFGFNAVVQ